MTKAALKEEAIDPNLAEIYFAGNRLVSFISKQIVGMDIRGRRKFLAEARLWLDERIADLDKALDAASPILKPESQALLIAPDGSALR
jgi:hypothetical protein